MKMSLFFKVVVERFTFFPSINLLSTIEKEKEKKRKKKPFKNKNRLMII